MATSTPSRRRVKAVRRIVVGSSCALLSSGLTMERSQRTSAKARDQSSMSLLPRRPPLDADSTVRTDLENGSDHHYLTFSCGLGRTPVTRTARTEADTLSCSSRQLAWHTADLDAEGQAAGLILAKWVDSSRPSDGSAPAPSEQEVYRIVRHVTNACGLSFRRRRPGADRRPLVYWLRCGVLEERGPRRGGTYQTK